MALEVLDLALGVWDDGVAAGCPVGGADLAVLVGVLVTMFKNFFLCHKLSGQSSGFCYTVSDKEKSLYNIGTWKA